MSDRAAAPLTLRDLDRLPVTSVSGIAPRKADSLRSIGVESILDLLMHYPRRWIDRTKEAHIAELEVGEEATILVRIQKVSLRRTRSRKTLVEAAVTDGTGSLRCTFFNQPWRERQLTPGLEVLVFGKLDLFQGRRQMANPVIDLVGDQTLRIVPVYPQSEKASLYTADFQDWVARTLHKAAARGLAEPVPVAVLREHGLVERGRAFRHIHAPGTMADKEQARRRLVFDELLRVQLALVLRKRLVERTTKGIAHRVDGHLVQRFRERLPFALTTAQERVMGEISSDLADARPMHRLLQGDVGAGKTLVAVRAMLVAVQGGHQAALMAPTAVLAEQHHLGIKALLEGLAVSDDAGSLFEDRPLRVELLTNRTTATERRRLTADLVSGRVDLLIGTHALLEEGVAFSSLGVVVIDEQHRFGVEQRAALRAKATGEAVPDVLVMTATPIPRTAAMTVYGDLDVSVLDELPPGRRPVETVWVRTGDEAGLEAAAGEASLWGWVRSEVESGRQAYVVCPLIDESEKLEVRSAEETYEQLRHGELVGLRVGLLHGRVAAADKEQVMAQFRSGALDVLVATTVIEVGVDVPNATVMVILDADRFGIAQLHQLRGRVGRGAARSRCYLVGAGATPEGEARLAAMVRSNDGFELAEVDLELRGEGTLMGERQKGRNDLRLASLRRDREWVVKAREAAFAIVDGDPEMVRHRDLLDEVELLLGEDDPGFLLKS